MCAIRPLNEEEQNTYVDTLVYVSSILPVFNEALSVLRPYRTKSTPYAGVDAYSRCGLGDEFFTSDRERRAGVLIHEVLHVFNHHFERGEQIDGATDEKINIAGDFEINSALDRIEGIDISMGIFPEMVDLARGNMMEHYLTEILKQDKDSETGENMPKTGGNTQGDPNKIQGNSGSSSKSGKNQENGDNSANSGNSENGENSDDYANSGNSADSTNNGNSDNPANSDNSGGLSGKCGVSDIDVDEVDKAGIPRASEIEKEMAQKETVRKLKDAKDSGKGFGAGIMDDLIEGLERTPELPKVSWQQILHNIMAKLGTDAKLGNADYSYSRVNRRMSTASEYIFPGMVEYSPRVTMGIDTSGSMSRDDFDKALAEVEEITKNAIQDVKMEFFCVDTQVKQIQAVSTIDEIKLSGGGGTDMAVAWDYILAPENSSKLPDVFVLATDGIFTNWDEIFRKVDLAKRRGVHSVILVTSEQGLRYLPEKMPKRAEVIDIS